MGIKPNGGATARLVPHGLSHFRSTFRFHAKIPHPGDAKICSRCALLTGRPRRRRIERRGPPPREGRSSARRSGEEPCTRSLPSEPGLPGGGRARSMEVPSPGAGFCQVQAPGCGAWDTSERLRVYPRPPPYACRRGCRGDPASAVPSACFTYTSWRLDAAQVRFVFGHEYTGGSPSVVILCGPEIMIACESRHRPAGAWSVPSACLPGYLIRGMGALKYLLIYD